MSIFKIGIKASLLREKGWILNSIMAFAFAIPAVCNLFLDFVNSQKFCSIVTVLLGMNGSILGLAIAGFSISFVIPKETMIFMVTKEAVKYKTSHFKVILDNYAVCFMTLFFSIAAFTIMYLLSSMEIPPLVSNSYIRYFNSLLIGLLWIIQIWVLIELKIFLFWIYDNSLMVAQSVAIEEGQTPFDE